MLKRANILLLYIEYINNVTVYGDCSKENLHFGKFLMTLSYNDKFTSRKMFVCMDSEASNIQVIGRV